MKKALIISWLILSSVGAIYWFVYTGDPQHQRACRIIEYALFIPCAIGGVSGFIRYGILRYPLPAPSMIFGLNPRAQEKKPIQPPENNARDVT